MIADAVADGWHWKAKDHCTKPSLGTVAKAAMALNPKRHPESHGSPNPPAGKFSTCLVVSCCVMPRFAPSYQRKSSETREEPGASAQALANNVTNGQRWSPTDPISRRQGHQNERPLMGGAGSKSKQDMEVS